MGPIPSNTRHLNPTLRTTKKPCRNNKYLRIAPCSGLLNCAGKRLRNKTDSHCEPVFYFCLSAPDVSDMSVRPRILKLSSKRHRLKPFEVSPHDCKQSFASNLRTVIAYKRLFSHPVLATKQILIIEIRNLSFFAQKIKKNSSKHCV